MHQYCGDNLTFIMIFIPYSKQFMKNSLKCEIPWLYMPVRLALSIFKFMEDKQSNRKSDFQFMY